MIITPTNKLSDVNRYLNENNPKRKTYLTYFKYGVYDAIINENRNETYYKSSAYYKQGWDYGRGILLHGMQEEESNG